MVTAVTTSPVPLAASGEARLPPLSEGETLQARVVARLADGATKLVIGKATVELRLPVTLEAGATVQFKVVSGGAEPKLALLLDASGKPLPPAQITPQTTGLPAGEAATQKLTSVILDATATTARGSSGQAQQTVEARVIAQLPDGKVRVELGSARLDIRPPAPLPSGATLKLSVQADGGAVRVRIADVASGSARATSAPVNTPANVPVQPATQAPAAPATAAAGNAPPQGTPGQLTTAQATSPQTAAQAVTALTPQSAPQATPPPLIAVSGSTALSGATVAGGQSGQGTPVQPAGAPQSARQAPVAQPVATQPAVTQPPNARPNAPQTAVVEAKVVARGPNGTVTLQLPGVTADIRPSAPIATGETLRLQPQADASGVRLVALGAAQNAARALETPMPVQNATNLPTLRTGDVLAVRVVGQTANGALALRTGAAAFEVRPPVALAAGVLEAGTAIRLKVDVGGKTPQVSLMPEAGGRTPAAGSARQTMPPETVNLLRQVAELARPLAATRQDSMAPLFANVAGLVRSGGGGMPDAVQKVMQDLLGFRMSPGDASSPTALKQAAQRSGTFQEANLVKLAAQTQARAAASLPSAAGRTLMAGGDLKSSLLQLRGALISFLGDHAAPATRKGATLPPPRAGSLPRGQMPSLPTIPQNATPRETARILLSDTDAAVSRIRLSQMATLGGPEHTTARVAAAPPGEWTFELPMAHGNQTAIAQFQISRDGGGDGAEGHSEAGWKLRFSVDLPQTGPVDTLLALREDSVAVTIWAENNDTVARFREDVAALHEAFGDVGLETTRIDIRRGRPNGPPQTAGYFVDWRT